MKAKMSALLAAAGLVFITHAGWVYAESEEGQQKRGHRGPPAEAFTACEGKSAGDAAQLTGRRGETVNGTCEAGPDGKLVLRPEGGPPPRGPRPSESE